MFNGKELDEETGLYYYGARYYDAKTSVWQSVDPLVLYDPVMEVEAYLDGQHNGGVFNSGNLASYSYMYGNPIRYTDPNGKQVDVVDFIPFIGSGRDIYRGIRDGDWATLAIGVGGLALDVATLGTGSIATGALKTGVKYGLKAGLKEAAEQTTKSLSKSANTQFYEGATKQVLGKAASSKILGANLIAKGTKRGANKAAHHIVAGKSKYARQARAILKRSGIDIIDAINGVFLPKNSNFPDADEVIHSVLHTKKYDENVTKRLSGASDVKGELKKIGQELLKGKFEFK